jgi:hypothetical protein
MMHPKKSIPRDPTYGDETALRALNAAADTLRSVIVRAVASKDARTKAIHLVDEATVVAFAAIKA